MSEVQPSMRSARARLATSARSGRAKRDQGSAPDRATPLAEAASAAATRRTAAIVGSGVSSAARHNRATAAAWPPRPAARSAHCSRIVATASSVLTAAPARCHAAVPDRCARRSPQPSAAWTARRSAARAPPYTAERISGWRNVHRVASSSNPAVSAASSASGCDAEDVRGAEHQRRVARRIGSSEEQHQLRRHRQRPHLPGEALLHPPPDRQRLQGRTHPEELIGREVLGQLDECQRVAARLGDDPFGELTIEADAERSRRAAPSRSRRRARGPRRSGKPSSRLPGSPAERSPKIATMPSARSRRAQNASGARDSRSIHCASSKMHSIRCRARAALAARFIVPRPSRNGVDGGPAASPSAEFRASRCGAGSRSIWCRIGVSSRCRAAKPTSRSGSKPVRRTTRKSSATLTA